MVGMVVRGNSWIKLKEQQGTVTKHNPHVIA